LFDFQLFLEISKGNVLIESNLRNCYGNKINWRDIFQHPDSQRARITLSVSCSQDSGMCSIYTQISW